MGRFPQDSMTHGDVRIGYTDYDIAIPQDHPSGLFWFHPHIHGIAFNQVTSGMAGIITIGDIQDYVCKNAACAKDLAKIAVQRHIIITEDSRNPEGTALCWTSPTVSSATRHRRRVNRPGVAFARASPRRAKAPAIPAAAGSSR